MRTDWIVAAGSEHDVVERTLIGPGVVFAANLEARRVGEHAVNLFLAGRRVPVPARGGWRRAGDRPRGVPGKVRISSVPAQLLNAVGNVMRRGRVFAEAE